MKIRLDKYLADMGLGTRKEVKELLKKGCVFVNGEVVKKPETKADTETDRIFCNGREIGYVEMEYWMLNKPAGVLTATEDKKQETVLDLLPDSVRKDVFPVGRLDKDTEGLLLITNDGMLAHELLSPKKHVPKRYLALVDAVMTEDEAGKFAQGVWVPAYQRKSNNENENDRFAAFLAMPAKLAIISVDQEKNQSEIEIEVCEGKFHQVKRMCEAVGAKVLYLKRLSMGSLVLDDTLRPGEYRKLTKEESQALRIGAEHGEK
jgi:16S rRNA pseudouridine516 synthase